MISPSSNFNINAYNLWPTAANQYPPNVLLFYPPVKSTTIKSTKATVTTQQPQTNTAHPFSPTPFPIQQQENIPSIHPLQSMYPIQSTSPIPLHLSSTPFNTIHSYYIYIQHNLSSATIPLLIYPTTTIAMIKQMILRRTNSPLSLSKILLLYQGKHIQETYLLDNIIHDTTAAHYNINRESLVQLLMPLNGGAKFMPSFSDTHHPGVIYKYMPIQTTDCQYPAHCSLQDSEYFTKSLQLQLVQQDLQLPLHGMC